MAELDALKQLARRFQPLSPAEEELLRAAATGTRGFVVRRPGEQDEPEHAQAWSDDANVRSELLHWLCTDQQAVELVHASGIWLRGARFAGDIDFTGATLEFRLALVGCAIEGEIRLTDARVRSMSFNATWCGGLQANRLRADGSVFLDFGFRVRGPTSLYHASFGGILSCEGGAFLNPGGHAIAADGLEAKGVLLRRGFRAEGTVTLIGAAIAGDLDCEGGVFVVPEPGTSDEEPEPGPALNLDGATVGGRLFLRHGFDASGQVRLVNASVGRVMDCRGGRFSTRADEPALCANQIRVAGSVFCAGSFDADGFVDLDDASIDGSLVFDGATFDSTPGSGGLRARRARVGGTLSWRQVTLLDGSRLSLVYARAARLEDDETSWPAPDRLHLQGFQYRSLGDIPQDADSRRAWRQARLDWLRRQPRDEFSPQPYEQLVKVLRESGHEGDARWLAIAKQDDVTRYGGLGRLARSWNWLLRWTIGHGYRPAFALGWGIVLVLVGTLVFSKAHSHELLPAIKRDHPGFSAFGYSLDNFLPIVTFRQEDGWAPADSWPWGSVVQVYYWTHIAAGWLLTTLAVLGVTGLVRRD